jgi:sulfur carrier protein
VDNYLESVDVSATVEGSSKARRLVVNGEARDTAVTSLAALLDDMGYGGQKVATALNGEFVPERAREQTRLAAGDQIEIVAPRQGG